MSPFAGWDNFYLIVGGSAGALIGLQFVVITLIADVAGGADQAAASSAFATPTVMHFGAALLVAGIGTAPWSGRLAAAVVTGLVGLGGIVYEFVVIRKMRRQNRYRPEFEDWVFHAALPLAAYAALVGAAAGMLGGHHGAGFAVAAAAMGLLVTGIHNAWDAVTYHVFVSRPKRRGQG